MFSPKYFLELHTSLIWIFKHSWLTAMVFLLAKLIVSLYKRRNVYFLKSNPKSKLSSNILFLQKKLTYWNMLIWQTIYGVNIIRIYIFCLIPKHSFLMYTLNIKPAPAIIMKKELNCRVPYVVYFMVAFILITCNFYSRPLLAL